MSVDEVLLSLVASVVTGSAVWSAQRLLRYHRIARKRAFFGVAQGAGCVLISPRHFSSSETHSVHRRDMAALVELATVVNECGGTVEILAEDALPAGFGRQTEFCVGGPTANARTAVHLRAIVPGVRFGPEGTRHTALAFRIGATEYPASSELVEYAVLARTHAPETPNPVFVIAGQTARANLAAARLLASRHESLRKAHGSSGRFCLVLKVVEPLGFGADLVEIEADATADAFTKLVPLTGGNGPDDSASPTLR